MTDMRGRAALSVGADDDPPARIRRLALAALGRLTQGLPALSRSRAGREAVTHRIHSALLAGVAAGVAGPDHLPEVLHHALRATRGALGYDSVLLFLVPNGDAGSPETQRLRLVAGAGAVPAEQGGEAYEMRADRGLIGRAVMHNQYVVANDARSDPDFQPLPGAEATRAELSVPLRLDGGVVGALAVTSNRRNAFDEHDVTTVSTLADQLAMAVARSRLSRERMARTAELARLKAFSEGVVQGIREGIVVTDADGAITFANRHFESMLGYPSGTLVGRHWQGLVPPEWRKSLPDHSSQPGRTETRLVTHDGRELAVQTSSQPRWADDRFDGAILLFTDITERVRAEVVSRALGEAGMALQAASSEAAVYDTLRRQAEAREVRVIVTTLDGLTDTLAVRFASLDARGLKVVSRALGAALDSVRVAVSLAPTLDRAVAGRTPAFVADPCALVATLLPPSARHLAPGIVRRLRLGAMTHVPMLVASRPVGLVSVSHPSMTERDQAAAWAFANQVATAVDRGRLHTETERRSQELEVLAEAAQRLAATADVAELSTGIAEQVLRVFDADAATLYVHDEASHRLELASAPGYSPAERKVMETTAWSRHPAWVVRNRQALLAGDTGQDPRVVYIGSRPRFSSVMYA
ncbi:MAG: GAF domain-containing protein, partial [Anaerolineae bacterium]